MNNQSYQDGYNDALKYAEKNYIPLDTLDDSFNKFLDKINNLKSLLKESYNKMLLLVDEYKDLGFLLEKIDIELGDYNGKKEERK